MSVPPMLTQLKTCSNRGVPLVAITAPDQGETMRKVLACFGDRPKLLWDGARGLVGVNPPGAEAAEALGFGPHADDSGPPPPDGSDPTVVFPALMALPAKAIVVVLNAHLCIRSDYPGYQKVIQAVWNLRDPFKDNARMVIMLAPLWDLPPELNQDVIVLEDPRPTREEVAKLVVEQHGHASNAAEGKIPPLTDEVRDEATRAAMGFPLFLTEQIVAVSIDPKSPGGINLPNLWLRKKQEIRKLQGCEVHEEGSFATVGGHEEAKRAAQRLFNGKRRPECVVILDEMEKAFAGFGTDSSGVKTESVGILLQVLQDWHWIGYAYTGVARSGKTALAKAMALEFGIPVIGMNIGRMQDKHVGVTGANIMAACHTAHAIGNGRVLAIAVSNSVKAMPAELVGRFDLGTFFFDLAAQPEHDVILDIYSRMYEIPPVGLPDLAGWTGNDIRRCYEMAAKDGVPLIEAARSIVPYGVANRKLIESQRAEADGVYLSSSYPGVFRRHTNPQQGRAFQFQEESA